MGKASAARDNQLAALTGGCSQSPIQRRSSNNQIAPDDSDGSFSAQAPAPEPKRNSFARRASLGLGLRKADAEERHRRSSRERRPSSENDSGSDRPRASGVQFVPSGSSDPDAVVPIHGITTRGGGGGGGGGGVDADD